MAQKSIAEEMTAAEADMRRALAPDLLLQRCPTMPAIQLMPYFMSELVSLSLQYFWTSEMMAWVFSQAS